jgi:hypothetical protein
MHEPGEPRSMTAAPERVIVIPQNTFGFVRTFCLQRDALKTENAPHKDLNVGQSWGKIAVHLW